MLIRAIRGKKGVARQLAISRLRLRADQVNKAEAGYMESALPWWLGLLPGLSAGAGALWSQTSALVLMAPAGLVGDWIRLSRLRKNL